MKLLSHALPNLSFNYVRVVYMLVILNLIDSLITCSILIFLTIPCLHLPAEFPDRARNGKFVSVS